MELPYHSYELILADLDSERQVDRLSVCNINKTEKLKDNNTAYACRLHTDWEMITEEKILNKNKQ